MQSARLQNALKALLLLALALFLYTRLAGGTLFFYINQRFVVYTMIAIVGLVLVALSYRPQGRKQSTTHDPPIATDKLPAPVLPPTTPHDHRLTWSGVALILLPIVLGVVVPPQPLGAAALANREVNVTMQRSSLPAAVRAAAQKGSTEKNVLDWLNAFAGGANSAATFAGQPAKVTGFVFRDDRFAADQFMVTRFVVSCCVADANVAGMVVRWPEASGLLADQWVEVSGVLEAGKLGSQTLPVLAAQQVKPVDVPDQPYLYP